LLIYYKVQT